jgi:hypothetical protein
LVECVSDAFESCYCGRVGIASTNVQRCAVLTGFVRVNNIELTVETLVAAQGAPRGANTRRPVTNTWQAITRPTLPPILK